MAKELAGKKIAILLTNGFEQAEMTGPREALNGAGAQTQLISPAGAKVKAWQHTQWGDEFPVDVPLDRARPDDYDILLLPGGVMNPDKLRMEQKAVDFVRSFMSQRKPIAAICHGPWLLVEADVIEGKKVTSWPSIKTDLKNAGANWTDQEVVIDGNLITSRKPDDIPAFSKAIIEEFGAVPAGRR